MSPHHDLFIQAIHQKRLVTVTIDSNEKGIITRKCICYDYGPSRRYKDGLNRYHFNDLDSPDGMHNLSILPAQLIWMEVLEETFEPGDYITWIPTWFIKRDWGNCS